MSLEHFYQAQCYFFAEDPGASFREHHGLFKTDRVLIGRSSTDKSLRQSETVTLLAALVEERLHGNS